MQFFMIFITPNLFTVFLPPFPVFLPPFPCLPTPLSLSLSSYPLKLSLPSYPPYTFPVFLPPYTFPVFIPPLPFPCLPTPLKLSLSSYPLPFPCLPPLHMLTLHFIEKRSFRYENDIRPEWHLYLSLSSFYENIKKF